MSLPGYIRLPAKVIDQIVENKTGGLVDLSEIFSMGKKAAEKEIGDASNAVLAVSMLDGSSAVIWWDPTGFVSSSEMISVVQSIISDRPSVTSIRVVSQPIGSQEVATHSEEPTESTSEGGVVSVTYSDIEEEPAHANHR